MIIKELHEKSLSRVNPGKREIFYFLFPWQRIYEEIKKNKMWKFFFRFLLYLARQSLAIGERVHKSQKLIFKNIKK